MAKSRLVDFTWYKGYSFPWGMPGDKPKNFACALTAEGYKHIEFLSVFNESCYDPLCNNVDIKKVGAIYKWVPDKTNYVEKTMSEYKALFKDELTEIAESHKYPEKKPKIKTKDEIEKAYRSTLRAAIRNSIEEVKNGMHRPQQGEHS